MREESADASKQRREAALRQLATEQNVVSSLTLDHTPHLLAPARSKHPRWLVPVVVLLLVAVSASAAYTVLRRPGASSRPQAAAIPTSLVIDLYATAHFDCPTGVVWAPSGQQIAVLGDNCQNGQQAGQSPYIAVFDARTGKKVTTFDLTALSSAAGLAGSAYDATWTPDSRALIVPGVLAAHDTPTDQSAALLILPLDGSHPQVYGQTVSPGTQQVIWNVRKGTIAVTMTSAMLPPALSYRWAPDGHIVPDVPFPTHSPANTYTGRASSASGFSYWQAGQIDQSGTTQEYISAQTEWSPDGQYLMLNALEQSTLAGRGARSTPLPDASLRAALVMLQQFTPTIPEDDHINVAWSPDGKLLATIPPTDELTGAPAPTQTFIYLLDTTSGSAVKQLRYVCKPASYADTPGANAQQGCNGDTPVWSPTGAQIALLDMGTVQLALLKV